MCAPAALAPATKYGFFPDFLHGHMLAPASRHIVDKLSRHTFDPSGTLREIVQKE
jgi:hypothetical protein